MSDKNNRNEITKPLEWRGGGITSSPVQEVMKRDGTLGQLFVLGLWLVAMAAGVQWWWRCLDGLLSLAWTLTDQTHGFKWRIRHTNQSPWPRSLASLCPPLGDKQQRHQYQRNINVQFPAFCYYLPVVHFTAFTGKLKAFSLPKINWE